VDDDDDDDDVMNNKYIDNEISLFKIYIIDYRIFIFLFGENIYLA